jgi:hypothetical protein
MTSITIRATSGAARIEYRGLTHDAHMNGSPNGNDNSVVEIETGLDKDTSGTARMVHRARCSSSACSRVDHRQEIQDDRVSETGQSRLLVSFVAIKEERLRRQSAALSLGSSNDHILNQPCSRCDSFSRIVDGE